MKIERLPVEKYSDLLRALNDSRSEEQLPDPNNSIVLGAFEGEEMIGCIGASRVWLVSPLWTERKYRGNGLPQKLAEELGVYNEEKLREVCVTTNPHVELMIFQIGFTPIEGQLFQRKRHVE